MKTIIIWGSGTRALSIALVAINKGIKPILLSFCPLTHYLDIGTPLLHRREPITFDAVSLLDERYYGQWRLDNYLNKPYQYNSLSTAEACPCYISNEEYLSYLKYLKESLITMGALFYECDRVIDWGTNYIRINEKDNRSLGKTIRGDAIAITNEELSYRCDGNPYYVNDFTNLRQVWEHELIEYNGGPISIIGEGDLSAKLVYLYASKGYSIYWFNDKKPRISKFDYPVSNEVGEQSFLSNYYRDVLKGDISLSKAYLNKFMKDSPKVHPMTWELINSVKDYISVLSTRYDDTHYYLSHSASIIDARSQLPINLHHLLWEPYNKLFNTNKPLVSNNYRSPNGIYFSGPAAMEYGGLAQLSNFSAGSTALTIIEDLLMR